VEVCSGYYHRRAHARVSVLKGVLDLGGREGGRKGGRAGGRNGAVRVIM